MEIVTFSKLGKQIIFYNGKLEEDDQEEYIRGNNYFLKRKDSYFNHKGQSVVKLDSYEETVVKRVKFRVLMLLPFNFLKYIKVEVYMEDLQDHPYIFYKRNKLIIKLKESINLYNKLALEKLPLSKSKELYDSLFKVENKEFYETCELLFEVKFLLYETSFIEDIFDNAVEFKTEIYCFDIHKILSIKSALIQLKPTSLVDFLDKVNESKNINFSNVKLADIGSLYKLFDFSWEGLEYLIKTFMDRGVNFNVSVYTSLFNNPVLDSSFYGNNFITTLEYEVTNYNYLCLPSYILLSNLINTKVSTYVNYLIENKQDIIDVPEKYKHYIKKNGIFPISLQMFKYFGIENYKKLM